METSTERIKPVSRIVRWGIPILLILIPLLLLSYCTFLLPSHYEKHSISEYSYSSLEIDSFDYMPPYRDDFDCVDCDYFYKYDEKGLMNNILDRGLYYFVYTEEGYPAAKAYCLQRCLWIGTEPTEEYNGYLFYDFYGSRNKEKSYHGDNYPQAFKRVFFNEEKHVIGFFGIYTSGKQEKRLAETLSDWSVFLNTYFDEWYSFD